MSQPVGLGIPLSSNNRANFNTPLGSLGPTSVGVQSLKGNVGNVTILGDASMDVTSIGSGQFQISTAGNAQNLGAVTCSSLNASGAVAAVGAVNAASVSSSGAVSGATLSAPGAGIIGGTLTTLGLLATGTSTLATATPPGSFGTFQAGVSPDWGAAILSGSLTNVVDVPNGSVIPLDGINNLLAASPFRDSARFVIISIQANNATFANGIPNCMYGWTLPAYQSGTGLSAGTIFNQNNSIIINGITTGGLGTRTTEFEMQNVSGVTLTGGYTYYWSFY